MKYVAVILALAVTSCVAQPEQAAQPDRSVQTANSGQSGQIASSNPAERTGTMDQGNYAVAILGGGCFWCLEAAYEVLPGVLAVESGYAGGTTRNPSYEQVISGITGHAEVVRIMYDPAVLSYDQLLDLFFRIHDPTTLNRQGNDVGTQYRSIILYGTEQQKQQAERFIATIAANYTRPIVTELQALHEYWVAEDYHQDFYARNPDYGYCQVVVAPKVQKAKDFASKLDLP
jgi:peptide-methionine (S)-S-oxide reductase